MPTTRHLLASVLVVALAAATAPRAALGHAMAVRFEQLTVRQGLPDGQIHALHQDRRGFMWVATRDGLGRYDGHEVRLFRHDPDDPLSINGNWVGPLLEDLRGRLWITLGVGGIDRFDPVTGVFEHLDLTASTPEVSDFGLTDLELDPSGAVWIATYAHGLYRVDGDDSVHHFDAATTSGLDSNTLDEIELDSEGYLWISTCGGGVSVMRRDKAGTGEPTFTAMRRSTGLSSDCPQSLHVDDRGAWIGTDRGIDLVRVASWPGEVPELRVVSYAAAAGGAGVVRHLTGDRRGTLWAGIEGRGLGRLDPDSGEWRLFPFAGESDPPIAGPPARNLRRNSVAFLHVAGDGGVWVGAFGSGVYRYDPEGDHIDRWASDPADPQSLAADEVTTALVDRADNLWVGTSGRGLSIYSPWRFKLGGVRFDPLGRDGLRNPVVLALAIDDDYLWIGTAEGLERLDVHSGELVPIDLEGASSPITALAKDPRGELWVGTARSGLFRYSPASGESRAFEGLPGDPGAPRDRRLSVLRPGLDPDVLWLGTTGGHVERLDTASGEIRHTTQVLLEDGRTAGIWALEEDPAGYLWIGVPSLGLFRLDLASGEQRRYTRTGDAGDLNNRTVNSLLVGADDRLWVGTYSGGLNAYLEDEDAFDALTARDGLPSNMIEAMLEQPVGVLWLATRHGLARYDLEEEALDVYVRRDGLVVDTFARGAAAKSRSGDLYFGGLGGVVSFHPDDLAGNPHVPAVELTRFRRLSAGGPSEQALDGVEEVVVRPGDRVFSFTFAALDFADPGRNRYAYKLEGFDDTWVDAGVERSATYTNIDPGDYVFRVRGANADGAWNLDGASVRLRVEPPFYRTAWFRGLEGLAALALLVLAYRWQRGRLLRRERRQQERREHERKSRELRMARQIQLSLLPREDHVAPHLEVAGRHRTASEVGGDYFDVIESSRHGLCVTLGDAVGHGMAAGLVVSMVKAGLLNALRDPGAGAADLVAAVDAVLRQASVRPASLARAGERQPVSMGLALALIDRHRRVDLSSVAMPYPYLWRAGERRLESLELGGLPLGQRHGQRPRSQSFELEANDLLVFVTDGLVERLGPGGEPWGYEALETALQGLCEDADPPSPAWLADALLAACDRWAGGREADDDLTVLAVKAREASGSQRLT